MNDSTKDSVDFILQDVKFLPEKMQKWMFHIHNLIDLSDLSLKEKTLLAPKIHLDVIESYYAECRLVKLMEQNLEKKKKEYSALHGKPNVPKFKTDAEMTSNTEITRLTEILDDQYQLVKMIKDVLEVMKSYNFSLKNHVDLVKLDSAS